LEAQTPHRWIRTRTSATPGVTGWTWTSSIRPGAVRMAAGA